MKVEVRQFLVAVTVSRCATWTCLHDHSYRSLLHLWTSLGAKKISSSVALSIRFAKSAVSYWFLFLLVFWISVSVRGDRGKEKKVIFFSLSRQDIATLLLQCMVVAALSSGKLVLRSSDRRGNYKTKFCFVCLLKYSDCQCIDLRVLQKAAEEILHCFRLGLYDIIPFWLRLRYNIVACYFGCHDLRYFNGDILGKVNQSGKILRFARIIRNIRLKLTWLFICYSTI